MRLQQMTFNRMTLNAEGAPTGSGAPTLTPSSPSDPGGAPDPAANPDPAADPAGNPNPAPDPAAEAAAAEAAAAAAAAAVVPETAEAYAVNVGEKAKPYLGEANDPMMNELRGFAKEKGWTQGQFDSVLSVLDRFADKGLLGETFSPAAELAKLGDNGPARQQEAETFADALLQRGEITAEEHVELKSLVPSAAGVQVIEKLRKMMGPAGQVQAPGTGAGGQPGDTAEMVAAREMRRDARYDTDSNFRRKADEAWVAAYTAMSGGKG